MRLRTLNQERDFLFGIEEFSVISPYDDLKTQRPLSNAIVGGHRLFSETLNLSSMPFSIRKKLLWKLHLGYARTLFAYFQKVLPDYELFDEKIRGLFLEGRHTEARDLIMSLRERYHNKFEFTFDKVCISLLDLRWHFSFKIFLLEVFEHIVGLQHGGAYDLWRVNHVYTIERNAVDEFLSWNIFGNKPRIFRYKKQIDLSLGVGLVVPHLKPPMQLVNANPSMYNHLIANDTYNDLHLYAKQNKLRFAHHPKSKSGSFSDRLIPNIYKVSHTSKNYFSYFGSTLFEYAHYYGLNSVLLVKSLPNESDLTDYGKATIDMLLRDRRIEFLK